MTYGLVVRYDIPSYNNHYAISCPPAMSERKGKLLVNAGKGCKYREILLNKDARLALYNLDYTIHAGSDVFVFKGQRGTLSPRGVQLMGKSGYVS